MLRGGARRVRRAEQEPKDDQSELIEQLQQINALQQKALDRVREENIRLHEENEQLLRRLEAIFRDVTRHQLSYEENLENIRPMHEEVKNESQESDL